MNKIILTVVIIAGVVFNSCKNPTDSIESLNLFNDSPIVPGIVITGYDSPVELGRWGSPHIPGSIRYNIPHDTTGGISIGLSHLQLEAPYPNPARISQVIQFGIPIACSVKVWIVSARLFGQKEKSFQNFNGSTFVMPNQHSTAVILDRFLSVGYYACTIDINGRFKDLKGGFYRIYLAADGHLLWRDVLLVRDLNDVPMDLRYLYEPH